MFTNDAPTKQSTDDSRMNRTSALVASVVAFVATCLSFGCAEDGLPAASGSSDAGGDASTPLDASSDGGDGAPVDAAPRDSGGDAVLPEPKRRPNILLIFTDDHAYQAISAYGSTINRTPNIDRLADEGLRFDRALVTNSLCGPMRAVVQTGKYSHKNGFMQNGNRFDGSQQTFPKLLQQAGYQTALIGKWHLDSTPTGYDHYEIINGQGTYYNPQIISPTGTRTVTGYTTDIITDLTLDWLETQRDPDKPFLLMYQHKAPHREWAPGPDHLTMYSDVEIPEPPTLFDDYVGRGTPARTQQMTIARDLNPFDLKFWAPFNLNAEQRAVWDAAYGPENDAYRANEPTGDDRVRWRYQRYIKDYLRCVAGVDDSLGRVLAYLDEQGLTEDTIVVYTSDQGFFLGEHGWFDKRWMYEESFRTPLIVRWPGVIEPGSVSDRIVSTLDLPETFLEAAGVPVPSDMQGRSLVPLFLNQTPADWRTSFYYHYYEYPGIHAVRRHYGVATDRYKLIHFYESAIDEWELYDRQVDPQELTSVYGRPEYAAVQAELHAELTRLRQELEVPAVDP